MKRKITIFILIILLFSIGIIFFIIVNNNDNKTISYRAIKEYYESSDEDGTITYKYNRKGYLIEKYDEDLAGKRQFITRYEYNILGCLIAKYRTGGGQKFDTFKFEYDEENKLIKEYHKRYDGYWKITRYEYEKI